MEKLKQAPYNPRKISKKQLDNLKKSMIEFGDLSGVVLNKTTGNLIGGHQRIKVLGGNYEIKNGQITSNIGEFSYREVEWPEEKEKLANIAANNHGGEFDSKRLNEMLTGLDFDFDSDLIGMQEKNKTIDEEHTDENCEMPIVPDFFERHQCFIIVTHNEIDENFVREIFELTENHVSLSGDKKTRKTNVIGVERLKSIWANK